MEETAIRPQLERHARALVAGDVAAAVGDFPDKLRRRAAEILTQLPAAIDYAELTTLERDEGAIVARVRFSGADTQTTIEYRWEEAGGDARIVAARLVDPADERPT